MNKMSMIVFVFIAGLLLVGSVSAANYYVTPTGAGSHNGQLGNEWTIYEAAANAQAGDTIYLSIGTYTLNSALNFNKDGTQNNPITWIGTISPTDISVESLSSDGTQSTLLKSTYSNNGAINMNGDYNIFKNIVFQQDTPAKVLAYISGNYITWDTVASKYPSNVGSSSNHLILVYGHHVTITHSSFYQGPRTIIWVRKNSGDQADYFTMEYSILKGATNHPPIQIFPATNSQDRTTIKRPIVRNNIFIDNPYANLYTRYCEEFAFYNNIFIRSGTPYDIDKHTGFHYPTGLPEDVMNSSRGIIAYNTIIEDGKQNIMNNVGSNEVNFVNNIYYSTYSEWSSLQPFRFDGDWNAIYNHRNDYNLYYFANVPDAFTASQKIRGTWGTGYMSVWYPNWKSVTKQETHSITNLEPAFKNAAEYDYSPIGASSPQAGKGMPVTIANGFWMDINTDYFGNPRDPVNPTIGAIELGSSGNIFSVVGEGDSSGGGSGSGTGSYHPADTNQNGCISLGEISTYVGLWISGQVTSNGVVTMSQASGAVSIWMSGC